MISLLENAYYVGVLYYGTYIQVRLLPVPCPVQYHTVHTVPYDTLETPKTRTEVVVMLGCRMDPALANYSYGMQADASGADVTMAVRLRGKQRKTPSVCDGTYTRSHAFHRMICLGSILPRATTGCLHLRWNKDVETF